MGERRNCWTCKHADLDLPGKSGTCRAHAITEADDAALEEWIGDNSNRVVDGISSMPERTADGCPAYRFGRNSLPGPVEPVTLTDDARHALTCLDALPDEQRAEVVRLAGGGR